MNTSGIKKGDIILVELPAESGHAIVEGVIHEQKGKVRLFEYRPLGGNWQRSRIHRPPIASSRVKGWWQRRRG